MKFGLRCVVVIAGEGEHSEHYWVQSLPLSNASEWFHNTVKDLIQRKDTYLHFRGTERAVVEHFLYWLFYGKCRFEDYYQAIEDPEQYQTICIKIWIFANDHGLPKLQNQAMEALYGSMQSSGDSLSIVFEVLEPSPPSSILAKLAMDNVIDMVRNGKVELHEFNRLDSTPEVHTELRKRLADPLSKIPRDQQIMRPLDEYLVVEEA